jgi:hypothetical protein
MRLGFNPGTEWISVKLRASGGVGIEGAELWRAAEGTYVAVPGEPADATGAIWTDLPRRGPGGALMLQLYWSAFDPAHAAWRYPVTITVTDQFGGLLPGRDGHVNPMVMACDIGREVPNWDHHQTAISIV